MDANTFHFQLLVPRDAQVAALVRMLAEQAARYAGCNEPSAAAFGERVAEAIGAQLNGSLLPRRAPSRWSSVVRPGRSKCRWIHAPSPSSPDSRFHASSATRCRDREEPFAPLRDNTVRMYACGLTVYNRGHIGNFRTYVCLDVLRRTLKYLCGYHVMQVVNYTDVDDKTIAGAQKAGMPLREYTDQWIRAFREDAERLGIETPEELPRATDPANLEAMCEMIHALERNGHTYNRDGSVLQDRLAAFRGWSWRVSITTACTPGRVDVDEYSKDDARDFVLWKAAKPGEPSWECNGAGPDGLAGTSSARRWRCVCSATRRSTSTREAST